MQSMIGQRMLDVLKKNKISQTEASKLLGVSVGSLNHWCLDKREPDQDIIKKFCEIFHTTPNYLFGFDDEITESDRVLLQAFKTMASAQTSNNQNQNIPEQNKDR